MTAPQLARAQFDAYRARTAINAFDADDHLQELLNAYGESGAAARLQAFGARVATDLDALAVETNRDENLPRLARYDGRGNRVEGVQFHPGYHDIGRATYATGLMSLYATPGREFETLALAYLLGQNGEAGHCCPLACTAGMIKILQAAGGAEDLLVRLYDPNYDTHFHASQFLTEVQGGSDVGANALVATDVGEAASQDGMRWRLTGEKWFCSVIDAHLFLVTARPEGSPAGTGGVRAFVVPRTLPGGTTNVFAIRRLKYKLGTRSMASAEVDFQGAWARPVGDFRRTVEVVLNTSRLYNATIGSGFMQRAWREADAYARERTAFGAPILSFPIIARIVARLKTEACASRTVSFRLAHLSDRIATGSATDHEGVAFRMLVNLNKIWTALTCPAAMREAIEVFGGNGAIEEFSVLPRLLRDSLVMEAWEGGHGVLSAQILKDSRKGLHRAMFDWLGAIRVANATPARLAAVESARQRIGAIATRWEFLLMRPDAEVHMRDLVEELRAPVQALSLAAEGGPVGLLTATHLLAVTTRGYDALTDTGLMERVAAINV